MEWEKLPFREKAEYIKIGIKNGLRSIDDIKNAYHKYDKNLYQDGSAMIETTLPEIVVTPKGAGVNPTYTGPWAVPNSALYGYDPVVEKINNELTVEAQQRKTARANALQENKNIRDQFNRDHDVGMLILNNIPDVSNFIMGNTLGKAIDLVPGLPQTLSIVTPSRWAGTVGASVDGNLVAPWSEDNKGWSSLLGDEYGKAADFYGDITLETANHNENKKSNGGDLNNKFGDGGDEELGILEKLWYDLTRQNYYTDKASGKSWKPGTVLYLEGGEKVVGKDDELHNIEESNNQSNTNITQKAGYSTKKVLGIEKFLPIRVKDNDSKSSGYSQILEDDMAVEIGKQRDFAARKGMLELYDETHIPAIGDNVNYGGYWATPNAMDSIAKYAGMTNTEREIAFGLPFESHGGHAPFYNTSRIEKDKNGNLIDYNVSKEVFGGRLSDKAWDNVLLNSNYMQSFGQIPAHNFVRDFEYLEGGRNNGEPYSYLYPLEHAFHYFNAGLYNPAMKDKEEANVRAAGKKVLNNSNFKKWWEESGKKWFNEGKKQYEQRKNLNPYKK